MGAPTAYAELAVTSAFSFLRGASRPEEFVERAARLGHAAAALADLHTLGGAVRAHTAARAHGIPLALGARVVLRDRCAGRPVARLLLFASDVGSYGRLSRLLTVGKRRAEGGACPLELADLDAHADGLLAVLVPPSRLGVRAHERLKRRLTWLRERFDDDRLSLAASCLYGSDDRARLACLADVARRARVPLLAVNDVHAHTPERRPLQDLLACIRLGTAVEVAGRRLFPNAERHPKPAAEMARLFRGHEAALARAVEVALRAAAFSLDRLRIRYPTESVPSGSTPDSHLAALVARGAAERYPDGVPESVRERLDRELALVAELGYASYFLTVHEMVTFARSRGILCQGRGAAANSAACYCLGITALDPQRIDLLFERFVSRERNEPPDIDIDFEHERREEVIQHVYERYGRDRAALCAEVITYRMPSALRDAAKALGLSLDAADRLARAAGRWSGEAPDAREARLDAADPTVRRVLAMATELVGLPRHRSQHVGGFVMTEGALSEIVPIQTAVACRGRPERTLIEWDKDDLDALGILKVDVLGLGMLTAIRKTFDHIATHADGRDEDAGDAAVAPSAVRASAVRGFALHTIPPEDPAVYDMLCTADTVGVFQIESRAQRAMLPRLRPRCFYDLVIEIALVRPGPIQGRVVHPYLRRRAGEEPVVYPSPAVERVLRRTLGVPLFQEQAMTLAIVAAGFTPGDADRLRRAMTGWKRRSSEILALGARLVEGMVERGLPRAFAESCFAQLQGFSEYGFPESHAASFALIVYVSAWLKRHHPAAFVAALLDSQPMGFYAPAQLVRDAQEHGVEVRPVDVNHSGRASRLEAGRDPSRPALRLGLRQVRGLAEDDAAALEAAVLAHGPFTSLDALRRASGLRRPALRRLAAADAFGSLGLSRQAALWQVRALDDEEPPLFPEPAEATPAARADLAAELRALPAPLPEIEVARDHHAISLSLKGHPFAFLRDDLDARGVVPVARLADEGFAAHGTRMAVAGIVLNRQRPPTAHGVLFLSIEDETGTANLIVRPNDFERMRRVACRAATLLARGRVERRGAVVHLVVDDVSSLDECCAR